MVHQLRVEQAYKRAAKVEVGDSPVVVRVVNAYDDLHRVQFSYEVDDTFKFGNMFLLHGPPAVCSGSVKDLCDLDVHTAMVMKVVMMLPVTHSWSASRVLTAASLNDWTVELRAMLAGVPAWVSPWMPGRALDTVLSSSSSKTTPSLLFCCVYNCDLDKVDVARAFFGVDGSVMEKGAARLLVPAPGAGH